MNDVVVDVLLALAVAAELLCVVGVVLMRSVFDRLHYAAAATSVGPFLVLAAVLVREQLSSQGLETIAAVGLLFLASPLAVHATARAARRLDYGGVRARPEEKAEA
jgi:monovalent cation/proton antiporter MnhG/PhaG subunit